MNDREPHHSTQLLEQISSSSSFVHHAKTRSIRQLAVTAAGSTLFSLGPLGRPRRARPIEHVDTCNCQSCFGRSQRRHCDSPQVSLWRSDARRKHAAFDGKKRVDQCRCPTYKSNPKAMSIHDHRKRPRKRRRTPPQYASFQALRHNCPYQMLGSHAME